MVILDNQHIIKLKKNKAGDEKLSCGVIAGYKKNGKYIVAELIGMENEASEKRNKRFLISPVQYQQAECLAEEKQLQILGFYYSSEGKENGEPEIKHAFPGIIYIAAVGDDIKAWKLTENRKNVIYYSIEVQPEVYKLSSHLAIAV